MHLHFEKNASTTKCDCTILSLSWMGKVPDDIPEEEGWKLNRTNYYQEGWLATGNVRGIVGVTFTTSHCKKNVDFPLRTNYNLRGHRSDVILVKWNEPYQKLASCDSSGIIFVWIKYEGRWSVELINDRNTPVTNFSWSHDGRLALICYQDGFVLVGSVAGQRYWSSMLNLDATITCGIWTPDDQQVYFGTTHGQIIVMDVHGAMVSQVQLSSEYGIISMAWSCEKFKMEEGDTEPGVKNAANRSFVLAVSFQNGSIYLLKSFDDLSPIHISTGLNGMLGFAMEWSNSRELLAVAGTESTVENRALSKEAFANSGLPYNNLLKFYTETGQLLYTAKIPNQTSPVTAMTFGHNDRRIFIATGNQIHIAWISRRVASLQLMCRLKIQSCLTSELFLPKLPLPSRLKSLIGNLFAQTIRCCVPNMGSLREFVSRPPLHSTRLHCTMIRHDDESNHSSCYTLYLEFLGGLVPLLKGKRTSKIRPEFVIFDPQLEESSAFMSSYSTDSNTTKTSSSTSSHSTSGSGRNGNTDTSDSDPEDGCRSPRFQRKRKTRTKKKSSSNSERSPNKTSDTNENSDELTYVDTLPEHVKLVEVTSNIWGTKFKIHGLAKTLPANLGQVTYKTSLLHLQPRQMTLVITELRDDFPIDPDPNFNPNIFSEDEDDQNTKSPLTHRRSNENVTSINIAPMSPRPNRFPSMRNNRQLNSSPLATSFTSSSSNRPSNPPKSLGPLAKAESYEDDTEPSPVSNNVKQNGSNTPRQGPSYSNIITSYSRAASSSSSNQSRVAISPLYCEQSVPTLQSPKNAVAPSDIIFERPPAGQTTLMSYSSSNDYSNSVVQVKNALIAEHAARTNSHVNPVPLNLNLNLERVVDNKAKERGGAPGKKKDIQFIDDDQTPSTSSVALLSQQALANHNNNLNNQASGAENNNSSNQQSAASGNGNGNSSSSSSSATGMKRTQTIVSICPSLPDSITRSCSVGYLDDMMLTPSDDALSLLRKETPHKRLVLVDRKRHQHAKKCKKSYQHYQQFNRKFPKKSNFKKSKSLDSCDVLHDVPNLSHELNNLFQQMPKLNESSENTEDTEFSSTELPLVTNSSGNESSAPSTSATTSKRNSKEKFCSFFTSSRNGTPVLGRKNKSKNVCTCNSSDRILEYSQMCSFCQKNTQTISSNFNCDVDPLKTTSLNSDNVHSKPPFAPKNGKKSNDGQEGCSRSFLKESKKSSARKNLEIVTSFTDSPLFSRKYRASNNEFSNNNGNSNRLQSEHNTPILGRRKRFDNNSNSDESSAHASVQHVEVLPVESKTVSVSLHTQALTTLENIITRLRDLDEGRLSTPPGSPQNSRLPRSSPSSPLPNKKKQRHQHSSPIRTILNSPLLGRRQRKKQPESSDEENNFANANEEEVACSNGKSYRDLETFQKAQLRQKLKRGKIEPNGRCPSQPAPIRREFVMHNKAPMWNENSQVYQLDFGGRVTQESAKNFQIEFRGKQVMQFGRIDGNAYTLDFQYPFSALQAFSVALANVTQRLK